MQLSLYSWDGHLINDWNGSSGNYSGALPFGQRMNLSSKPIYITRSQNFPLLSGAILPDHYLTITIIARGTIHTEREQLKGWFAINVFQAKTLIAKDTADSDRQWYVTGIPVRLNERKVGVFDITLAIDDPIWRVVTASTSSWSVTASGDTKAITPIGDTFSKPVITITPTTSRTGQYPYKRWIPIYNRIGVPLPNYPLDVTDGGLNTATLIADSSISNQVNQVGGITAGALTIPVDTSVGGGLNTSGGLCYVDTEQIYYTSISGGNMTVYNSGGVTGRGWGGTTAATHADNAVMKQSKILANGNDLRVIVNGAEANRWLSGINISATKIWTNLNLSETANSTLAAAIAGSGAVSTISVAQTDAGLGFLNDLAQSPNNVLLIGSETFTYTGVNTTTYAITGVTRAQRGTSMASHAIGDTIQLIEFNVWIAYGNPLASTPTVDDTQKPLLDLQNSTNTSWVQTEFADFARTGRPASWVPQVAQTNSRLSRIFSSDQGGLANPASVMGAIISDYISRNVWQAETAQLYWNFTNPVGITTVSASGKKYAYSTRGWPLLAGLQYFGYVLQVVPIPGNSRAHKRHKKHNWAAQALQTVAAWVTSWTEAVPASAQTWTAFTHNTVSLGGTYPQIRLAFAGSIPAVTSNYCAIQFSSITLALDSSQTPVVSMNAEQGNYHVNATITNTLTGEFIVVTYVMDINGTLTIDCDAQTATYSDGSNVFPGLQFSTVRQDWLNLTAGVTNTLSYVDVGTGNVTVGLSWKDRSF